MAQARNTSRTDNASRDAHAQLGRIGSGARIRGRIAGDGSLSIEGEVDGEITIRGALTIAEGANVTCNVDAEDVTVAGKLEGNVNANGHVRILNGSLVRGDLHGRGISIEEGASFAGRLDSEFELPAELRGNR